MIIKTNYNDAFARDLKALFERHGIASANGWDDGSLIIYPQDERLRPPAGHACFFVEFRKDD